MDAREMKATLKLARDAIRAQEYKETLKHCKSILKQDKSNYNALVFIGVAAEGLEQPEQAIAAYRKAIDVAPEQILAWQGLCSFYEKATEEGYRTDLADVYEKLMLLCDSDDNKKHDIGMKLAHLYGLLGAVDKAIDIYNRLRPIAQSDQQRVLVIERRVVQLLEHQVAAPFYKQVVSSYQTIIEMSGDSAEVETSYTSLIKSLAANSCCPDEICLWCKKMSGHFPLATFPLEVTCQIFLDQSVSGITSSTDNIDTITEKLHDLAPRSRVPSLIKGYQAFDRKDYLSARDLLSQGSVSIHPPHHHVLLHASIHSYHMAEIVVPSVSQLVCLAKTQQCLHHYSQAIVAADAGLTHLSKKDVVFYGDRQNVARMLEHYKARSCAELGGAEQLITAIDICLRLLESNKTDLDCWLCLGSAYLKADKHDLALKALVELSTHGKSKQLHLLTGLTQMYDESYGSASASFRAAVTLDPGCPTSNFFLAKVLWDIYPDEEGNEACLSALIQAARLDPFYSPTFLYLGRYYAQVAHDLTLVRHVSHLFQFLAQTLSLVRHVSHLFQFLAQTLRKAKKCLEKAFQLNPKDSVIGEALVDMLTNDGDTQRAEIVLKSVTSKATPGSAKWAWLRLGLLYMKRGDPSAAIMCLQSALRADPADTHVWECLGDAYMDRGSYNAALKTFTKATQLNPSGIYGYYQTASIKQILGLHDEALTEYHGILSKSHDYTPALAGLAETHLSLAQSSLVKFFHGRAVDHCQSAIEHATRAVQRRPDFSSLWKLLGDACTIIYPVPDEICRMLVPSVLLNGKDKKEDATNGKDKKEDATLLSKPEILQLGGRCYGMALKQQTEVAALWHDLGINFYRQMCLTSGAMVSVLTGKAIQALQRAVTLETDSPRHWTALGVVAASKDVNHPALAQHCFIRAIQVEPSYVEAWTNLATLYLCKQNIELAHKVFKVAQATQPTHVNSWIGQALIAETVGDSEAMDLLRHAAEMDNHTEGAVGYASWVCSVMNDESKMNTDSYKYAICQMSATTAASDALAKYTDRIRTDATAFNMYGLLLEKQKLYKLAVKAFACATKLLEENRGPSTQLRAARINYARALCGLGKSEEAITQYQAAGKLGAVSEYAGMGLAAYRCGKLDISREAYAAAEALADTEAERADILVSLAMVLYKSGDIDATKTALFQCSQLSPASLCGLKALCSLGLLQRDLTLAAAALQELNKQQDSSADLPYLTACMFTLQGETNAARRHLAKCTHIRPDDACMWRHLSAFLLDSGVRCDAAACCAAVARHIDPTREEHAWLALPPVAGGWHSDASLPLAALNTAQKIFHTYPDNLSALSGLVSASLAQHLLNSALGEDAKLGKFCQSFITKIMSTVEEQLTYKVGDKSRLQCLHLWCVKQFVVIQLSVGETEHARQFLQNAIWLYEGDAFLQCLLAFSDQNMPHLKTAAEKDGTTYSKQLLALLYTSYGLDEEVENSYRLWIQHTSSREEKIIMLVKLAHVAFQELLKDTANDKWTSTFKESCDMALTLDSTCCAIYLMQAILHLRNNNQRTARHCFEQVLHFRDSRRSLGFSTRMASRHLLAINMDRQDEARVKRLLADMADDKELKDLHLQMREMKTAERVDHWEAADV